VDSEPIERMISTSDSDNESLDALSKRLAKSYKATANLSLETENAESGKALHDGHNNLLLNKPLPIEPIHEVEMIASQLSCDNEPVIILELF
jgi:hypothetical protein